MAEYWIRPFDLGPYGSNDGTSYADAWYRTRDVAISGGDTLYISGTLDDGASDGYAFTQIFRSPDITGTALNPIVIDGAPPAQPAGKIIAGGVNKINTGDWFDEGSGVWSLAGVTGSASWLYNEVEAWEYGGRMIRDFGSVPATGDAPAFYKDGANKLWYAPISGTPLAPVWTSGGSIFDFFSATFTADGDHAPDYVTIKNLKLRNSPNMIRAQQCTGWVIDNCDIGWAPGIGISLKDGVEFCTIQNCEIHDLISGIYASTRTETAAVNQNVSDCLIDTNHIFDIRNYYQVGGDCHAIGWQSGSRNVLSNNTIEDCQGTGITIYYWGARVGKDLDSFDNVVEDNIVRRIQNLEQDIGDPGSSAIGIEITGDNTGRTSVQEARNIIRNNTVSFCSKELEPPASGDHGWGIRLKTHKFTSVALSGNTIHDCTYGHYLYSQNVDGGSGDGVAGGVLNNETVYDCEHKIGYQGIDDVTGYLISNMTYSGLGDFEVLKNAAVAADCTNLGMAWDYPTSGYCTLSTTPKYNLYTRGVLGVPNVLIRNKGAVQPTFPIALSNELIRNKGAVQPVQSGSISVGSGSKSGPGLTFGSMGRMGA